MLSGSNDHTLRVCDARSGKCLLSLQGHTKAVTACTWSPDSQRVLSGSHDHTLRMWDAQSGKCLLTLAVLPSGETASHDGAHFLHASPRAWPHLAWRWLRPDGPHLLPAEFFAPLPA